MSRKLAGEASAEELEELERIIQEHPGWQNAVEHIALMWKQQPPQEHDTDDVEDAYLAHLYRLKDRNIVFDGMEEDEAAPKKRWGWWLAAASVAMLIGFAAWFYQNGEMAAIPQQKQVNEISTRPQSKSRVQLPDGSIVWLNAGSKLTYTPTFGKELREVELSGEGFFDVVKMADKPFIIHTQNIQIKVLGTAFNVKAYKDDKVTETSLVRGKIEVTINNRPGNKIILKPYEKLVVENEVKLAEKPTVQRERPLFAISKIAPRLKDSILLETSWMEEELVFREEKFEDLVKLLEARYNTRIQIRDNRLKEKRFTGTLTNEPVEKALEALQFIVPFEYESGAEGIVIFKP